MRERLQGKLEARTAQIGIIGLGYVGLPLAEAFCRRDFAVCGFDIDETKVAMLNAGESYVQTVPSEKIRGMVTASKFRATTAFAELAEVDVIILCVPTPLTRHREPDMTYIEKTTEKVAEFLRAGQLVVLESTTYPGTTAEVVKPMLEEGGLSCGSDFFLAYSPEREDPGNLNFETSTIPKVVGGDDEASFELARTLYEQIVGQVVTVSSLATAEAVKLTENIFRSVNIALVNELKVVFSRMGINIWEVIDAAKTKPFGYMAFYPGPGLGGHCIPIDPFYLTWKAREFEVATRFIELAGEINTAMPHYVVDRLIEAMDRQHRTPLNGARILMLGVAYKKNVDDDRESPAFKIMQLLEDRGAKVDYHDPFVPEIKETREYKQFGGRQSIELTAEQIGQYDACLICTDHDPVDYDLLVSAAKLVVDTRNATARTGRAHPNVVSA